MDSNDLKFKDDFKAVLNNISHTDQNGITVIRIAILATFYFEDAYTAEKREAVAACFDEYRQMCGQYLRWGIPDEDGAAFLPECQSFDPSKMLRNPDWNENDKWIFECHGGQHHQDASEFGFSSTGSGKKECEYNIMSYLSVSFPLMWFVNRSPGFPGLVLGWSRRLRPFYGYGGIGIIESPDLYLAQSHRDKVIALTEHFPGLEADYPYIHRIRMKEGIKAGNWLTLLSDHWIGRLNGKDALSQQLGEPFRTYDYPGGIMIQAGPLPEIGNTNHRIDTPNYRRLAKILRPIRMRGHSAAWPFDAEKFGAWLERFDE